MEINIKHIWFDFSDTISTPNKEIRDQLRYKTYAQAVGKPLTPELSQEYEALFAEHKSNSAVFASLGHDTGFWSQQYNAVDPATLVRLAEDCIPDVLNELHTIVPISIWSNIHVERFLPALGIDPKWFTFILSPDHVKKPKPDLEGFKLIIERSALPPENILFVGDSVAKEVIPAKSLGIRTGLMWITAPEADYCFKSFKDILALMKNSD